MGSSGDGYRLGDPCLLAILQETAWGVLARPHLRDIHGDAISWIRGFCARQNKTHERRMPAAAPVLPRH
eukprot:6201887-Karenia_brevis.AAC.1